MGFDEIDNFYRIIQKMSLILVGNGFDAIFLIDLVLLVPCWVEKYCPALCLLPLALDLVLLQERSLSSY